MTDQRWLDQPVLRQSREPEHLGCGGQPRVPGLVRQVYRAPRAPQINTLASVFCMSWYVDLELRGRSRGMCIGEHGRQGGTTTTTKKTAARVHQPHQPTACAQTTPPPPVATPQLTCPPVTQMRGLRHPKLKVSTPTHAKNKAGMLIWGAQGTHRAAPLHQATSHDRRLGTMSPAATQSGPSRHAPRMGSRGAASATASSAKERQRKQPWKRNERQRKKSNGTDAQRGRWSRTARLYASLLRQGRRPTVSRQCRFSTMSAHSLERQVDLVGADHRATPLNIPSRANGSAPMA